MSFAKDKLSKYCVALILILSVCAVVDGQQSSAIKLWYGKEQTFGKTGKVQRWANILGTVDSNLDIVKLDYSLNDGEFRFLNIGPDKRRLQRKGDFNVEIPIDDLVLGKNSVLIEAVDADGKIYNQTVILNWDPQLTEPDLVIKWGEVENLRDVAQPIDGLWRIEGDKVVSAPEAVGYDRVLGIGDMSWSDYEVLFPFEIRDIDSSAFETEESVGPALLVILRWMGHTDGPVACSQPNCGWEPYGGVTSFSWEEEQHAEWSLSTRWDADSQIFSEPKLELGKEYWMRFRVESQGGGNLYSTKIWDGGLQAEPESWTSQALGDSLNINSGSFLLVAHHIDLAIGTMQIMPIANLRYKIVDMLNQHTEFFVQLPYLVLWIIGILWALAYMKRDSDRGRWILVSFAILFVTSIVGYFLKGNLPDYLHSQGWITRRLTYVYIMINLIPIAGHFLAWGILFKTFWPKSKAT